MHTTRANRIAASGKDADDLFSQVFMAWLKDTREALTADKAKRFKEVFAKGVSEKQVVLRGLRLGVNTAVAISQGVYRPPLQVLDLHDNLMRDAGVETLAPVVHDASGLLALNLGGNDIGPAGILHLSPAIQSHKKLHTIVLGSECGALHANRIDSAAGKVLAEAVLKNKAVKLLDLNRNPLGLTDQEPFRGLASVLDKHPHLQVLRLGDTGMHTESAVELVSKLARNSVVSELDLQGNDLGHQAAEAFAKVFQERCDKGLLIPLRKLWLQNNPRIGERGSSPLFNSLSFAKASLVSLNMRNTGVTDDAALCLANALAFNASLQSINLSKNYITELGCMALARQLAVGESVTFLSLSSNKIRCDGAVALAAMLEENDSIRVLELDEARVSDQGCIALGVALTGNIALSHLKLGCNHISDEAGRAFCSLLEQNHSVQAVTMRGNQIDHATQTKLNKLLKRNRETKENEVPDKLHKEVVRLCYQQCKLQEANSELLFHQKARLKLQEEIDRHDAGLAQEREESDKKAHELLEKIRREEQEVDDMSLKLGTKEKDFVKFEEDIKQDMARLNDRLEEETARREEIEKRLGEKKDELDECAKQRDHERERIEAEAMQVRADAERYHKQAAEMAEKLRLHQETLEGLETLDTEFQAKEEEKRKAQEAVRQAKKDKAAKKKAEEAAANAMLFNDS